MHARLLAVLLTLGAAAALVGAPAASAAPCGQPDPDATPPSTKPVRAMLALDDKSSRTTLAFKHDRGHQGISLVFTASACDLPVNPVKPKLLLLTKAGSKDLPDDALSVKSVEADGSEFILKVDVNANAFSPGTYDGQLAARAPYLAPTNRIPFSVSRSEHRLWVPFLIGAAAGLAGLLWFALLRMASQTALTVSRRMRIFVTLACTLAGAITVFISYWDQEVWSLSDNFIGALTAGFTGATSGAMAGLVGVVWRQPATAVAAAAGATGNGQPGAQPAAGATGNGQPAAEARGNGLLAVDAPVEAHAAADLSTAGDQ